ncbi:FAD-dependent oxidoreductase [Nocardia blacklockiae]|uniref:FAD-dependent oxidoreductase n=1 Tax=Nocardia blacklockiae TaxID=480036 RepID=UPI001893E9F0|nr:FAD-dependent oxidoreductase [Nocardia blacklockiae]MBF6175753.1 FAD-binding oxidoreductase [Nocardia blacklockiae]
MRAVVVGSGIVGLTTAAALLREGREVVVVSAEPVRATTSYLAAAVWFPTAAGPAERVAAWSAETFARLERLAEAGAPGARMCESLTVFREEPEIPGWSRTVRGFRWARPDELPPGYRFGFRFAVPLLEMPVHLPWLESRVRRDGARWVRRTVESFDDLADLAPDVIVNCAGLRAGPLAGDADVYPIRGQIVRVTNPGVSVSVRDEAHPLGRAYVHPRAEDCILGGSLDTGAWDRTPDPELTQSILRRCRDLVPELAAGEVLETLVGLRPGRGEVRLEVTRPDSSPVPVVHNYGHGGSGVTIGHGCAREVADLVRAL